MSTTANLKLAVCQALGQSIARGLLDQDDQGWQHIDLKYAFDPAEYLQSPNNT